MNSVTSRPHGAGAAITITTKTVHSESPRRRSLKRPEHVIDVEEAEPENRRRQRQQQQSVQPASRSEIGMIAESASIKKAEGNREPCLGPIVHDKRYSTPISVLGLQSGFEESPEWHEHYGPSSRQAETEAPYLEDDDTRLLPDQSWRNTRTFSVETVTTANSPSDRSSIDSAELGSRKLLCLPRPASGRNLLKAGNNRLKHFIKSKNRSHFRTQSVPQEGQVVNGALQRLHLTDSKKDVGRKLSRRDMKRIANEGVGSSQKMIRNKESNSSMIIDLDQVEARQGVETHALITLSESWDEIFKSMGGFRTEQVADADTIYDGHRPDSVEMNAIQSDLSANAKPLGKHETDESRKAPVKSPPLPGPRTSSMYAIVQGSPTRQSLEVVLAELPAHPSPTRRSKPEPTNQGNMPTGPNTNWLGFGERLKPRLREGPSIDRFSKLDPGPDASQSTIALEAIEAELNTSRSLSPSTLTDLTQPFSVHCTPPQPVTAPTEPPIGPLPRLPEEFDRTDAASRASSHNSSPRRPSRPAIPPRSRHRRDPSANSASSKATIRPLTAHRGHHRKPASASSWNSRRANSISSAQSAPLGGITIRGYTDSTLAAAPSNNVIVTGFNQYNLGNSQDLRSPVTSEVDQDYDTIDSLGTIAMESSSLSRDVLSSRSQHIKGLKLRDLAKEKATRTRSLQQPIHLDDIIVTGSPSFEDEDESAGQTSHLPRLPFVSNQPPVVAPGMGNARSSDAAHQERISRPSSHQSRRSSSNRASRRTTRSMMSQSQIMVLAETDPDTQMFRASTPTGSLRRTESQRAESIMTARDGKVRKRKSKTSIRSQVHVVVPSIASGIPGITLNGEHTPPHSDPSSTQSSDDDPDMAARSNSSFRGGLHHVVEVVQEEYELASAPSERAEDKNYVTDQLRVKRLKKKSSDLKLAVTLLSRGLEKLTICMEEDEDVGSAGGYGLIEAEMGPGREGMGGKNGREAGGEEWVGSDHVSLGPMDREDKGGDASLRRGKSAQANDARPLSLVSRYSSVRKSER